MRVALMVTCINDALFPDTGNAVVALLRRLGVDVEFPAEQGCCGQPMVNTGYLDEVLPVVRNFARSFAGYDAVVTPPGTPSLRPPWPRSARARTSCPSSSSTCSA